MGARSRATLKGAYQLQKPARRRRVVVIPAKAGIQLLPQIDEELDPGFRRDDEQKNHLIA